jgi:hypothetical protein
MVAPATPALPLIVEGEAAPAGVMPTLDKSMDRIIKTAMVLRPISDNVLAVLVCMSFLHENEFGRRNLN